MSDLHAIPKAAGRYKLASATPTGKPKKTKGQTSSKLISKPTKHTVAIEGSDEQIPLKLFSKADKDKINAHFEPAITPANIALSTNTPVIKSKRPKTTKLGTGILDTVKDFATTLVHGRTDFPTDQKNILSQYGNLIVKSIKIGRTPLPSLINSAINVVTFGAFKKKLASSPYDKLFHLFIIATLDGGKTILIEKNAAINMKMDPPQPASNSSIMEVGTIPNTLTLQLMMDNAKKSMGSLFFTYDAIKNNCQDFILHIFKANGILNNDIQNFIKQDVKTLFQDFERTKGIMHAVTTLGSKVDILTKGGRLNPKPVAKVYKKIQKHLIGHIIDPTEPIDPIDITQTKLISQELVRMPPKKIYMNGKGLEGNAGIGGGMMDSDYDSDESRSDSDIDTDDEGCGLYVGSGIYAGKGVHMHFHVHPEGGKINWKKVGKTVWKVAKPIVKEVSHKYLPQLASQAGSYIGEAGATLLDQPEMAPMGKKLGAQLGKQVGTAADKKIQGLGLPKQGRFVKGSKEAMDWAAAMRAARLAKKQT
jgi:hypothetical protein